MRFDRVLMVDWSAAGVPTRPGPNTIWIGESGREGDRPPVPCPTRRAAEAWLAARIGAALEAGERVLAGFDFAFGYPAGFAKALGASDAREVWSSLAARLKDGEDNANNRFEVAAALNALFPPGGEPFWGCPAGMARPRLSPRKTRDLGLSGLAEHRLVELALRRPGGPGRSVKTVWQIHYNGSVGSQTLTGVPAIARLSARFAGRASVWPFDAAPADLTIVEIYPALLAPAVALSDEHPVRDARQVLLMARAVARLAEAGETAALFGLPEDLDGEARRRVVAEEGWIFGAGHEDRLAAALRGGG